MYPYICGKYKEPTAFNSIKAIYNQKITADLLLTKLVHQPLLSFSVWKKILSREIRWDWMFGKPRNDRCLFCPSCIHFVTMYQGLYLLFHYLRQGGTSLEYSCFVWDGRKKRRCFLSKRWINCIFLRISKLNTLALPINNFILL